MKLYKNICLVDTVYSLFIYLLRMNLAQVKHSFFFVGDVIDDSLCINLPRYVRIPTISRSLTWLELFYIRIKKIYKWFFLYLPGTNIYAQDHLSFSDIIIGNHTYTLIEDGPEGFRRLESVPFLQPSPHKREISLKRRIKYMLSHCSIKGSTFGTNTLCVNRWITNEYDVDSMYTYQRCVEYLPLKKMWEDSDTEKKEYIKKVFGISDRTIDCIKSSDLIIFSQPLMEDCFLSEQELFDIYKPFFSSYKKIAFKIHPRDHFDYKNKFPNSYIVETKAPMQLFNLLGVFPSTALTVCSTALSSMPIETTKIYLGTKINSKIFSVYGDLYN